MKSTPPHHGWRDEAGRRAPSGIRRYSSSDPIRVAGQDQSYLRWAVEEALEFLHLSEELVDFLSKHVSLAVQFRRAL